MADMAPREYRQSRRAEDAARTRRRIIAATRKLTVVGGEPSIDEIAAGARVSVQTVYAHFGSKRGLLFATIDEVQRDVGLYAAFRDVWSSPDGETALRRMVEATVRLWDGAWPFVEWSLRAEREDPEAAASLRQAHTGRRLHLWHIARRLDEEARLRRQSSPERAADLAFALTTAAAYEELVRHHGWAVDAAIEALADVVTAAVIEPGTRPVLEPPPDWSGAIALLGPDARA